MMIAFTSLYDNSANLVVGPSQGRVLFVPDQYIDYCSTQYHLPAIRSRINTRTNVNLQYQTNKQTPGNLDCYSLILYIN